MSKTVDALVASMLEKNPASRPEDGDAVAASLEASARTPTVAPDGGARAAIGTTERRFATVLLGRAPALGGKSFAIASTDDSLDDALDGVTQEGAVVEAGSQSGITIVPLSDGLFVGVLVAENAGPDAAQRIARCAIAMHARMPGGWVSLATGRAIVAEQVPVGVAIDRARGSARSMAGLLASGSTTRRRRCSRHASRSRELTTT